MMRKSNHILQIDPRHSKLVKSHSSLTVTDIWKTNLKQGNKFSVPQQDDHETRKDG